MLIEKNNAPALGDVCTFKLVSGEEIVGKLHAISADVVAVTRPVVIGVQMVGPQQAQIGFMPFMASAGEEGPVSFRVEAMLNKPIKTRQDVASNYIRATTGIEIPNAQQASSLLRG